MTTTAEKLKEMLISYPKGIYSIDTLEISHPSITQTYYLTREPMGISAYLETGELIDFEGTSIGLELSQHKEDLDQNFKFTFPDLNNTFDDEMDRIDYNDTESISVIYRQYISNDLSYPAIKYSLEVTDISQTKGIVTLGCGVSQLNWKRTGLTYNLQDFPMLKAI
jgi:hypothetical protein